MNILLEQRYDHPELFSLCTELLSSLVADRRAAESLLSFFMTGDIDVLSQLFADSDALSLPSLDPSQPDFATSLMLYKSHGYLFKIASVALVLGMSCLVATLVSLFLNPAVLV